MASTRVTFKPYSSARSIAVSDEPPVDPLAAKLSQVARQGRTGALVTGLDISVDTGSIRVETTLWVRSGADQWAPIDPGLFETFHLWREPEPLEVDLRTYDVVLLLDIIEHLTQPERFLDALRASARSLGDRPQVLVTTGNVAFFIVRLQALLGRFNYGKRGILDLTHTRLYTFKTLRHLFEQCGFRVTRIEGIPAPFPLALGANALRLTRP